jgi:type II secretory pathway component GspD/PulD (secretin)
MGDSLLMSVSRRVRCVALLLALGTCGCAGTGPVGTATPASVFIGGADAGRGAAGHVTQVIPLDKLQAADLADDLRPLLGPGEKVAASRGANCLVVEGEARTVKQLAEIVAGLEGQAQPVVTRSTQLRWMAATDAATLVNHLLHADGVDHGGRSVSPIAWADNTTNTVFVRGPQDVVEAGMYVLRDLDGVIVEGKTVYLFPLKHRHAEELEPILSALFNDRPGPWQEDGTLYQRGRPVLRIVADNRLNQLIVLGSPAWIGYVRETLQHLDQPEHPPLDGPETQPFKIIGGRLIK